MMTPYLEGFKVAAIMFGSGAQGTPQPLHVTLPAPGGEAPEQAGAPPGGQRGFASDADDAEAAIVAEVAAFTEPVSGAATAPPAQPRGARSPLAPLAPSLPFPHTRWAFAEGVESFTPEDFSTLQRSVKEEAASPSLRHALALLRLGNHDSEVFYKFKQVRPRHPWGRGEGVVARIASGVHAPRV